LAGDFLAARQLPYSPFELRTLHRFILGQICPNVTRISPAGLREGHVHDVIITKEAPNYRVE
jgi:hypothetical protein